MDRLRLLLQVSRPGLYLVTVWVYLLPTGALPSLWAEPSFWVGLLYCTAPLNLLVYWWNDLGDTETDETNPRKGGMWFGGRTPVPVLWELAPLVAAAQVPFLLYFAWRIGAAWVTAWFAAVLGVNYAYNDGPIKLSSQHPPLDFLGPLGYLLLIPLSVQLNRTRGLPIVGWAHTLFYIARTQLWTEIMDAPHDKHGGRVTSALALAAKHRRLPRMVLIAILALELAFVCGAIDDAPVCAFSALSFTMAVIEGVLEERSACTAAVKGKADGTCKGAHPNGSLSAAMTAGTTVVLGIGGLSMLWHVWRSGVLSAQAPA